METIIHLEHNTGFSWHKNKTTFIKGYFFDSNNRLYDNEDMLNYFSDIKCKTDFVSKIKNINGLFSVVIQDLNTIYIASDTSRIFPLFYFSNDQVLHISDSIHQIKSTYTIEERNTSAEKEFEGVGYTLGDETLISNIYQTQSNEFLIFKNGSLSDKKIFYSYATDKTSNSNKFDLKTEMVDVFENSFRRLIQSLNGRQAVVPLSGGYDSRLIVTMLKKYDYDNVVCYTYGKKENLEVQNAKKTARLLNYPWIFIDYTNELIDSCMFKNDFNNYINYQANYVSMPFFQEYFAVNSLIENKQIEKNAIFIPGHSGDILGGSLYIKMIPKKLNIKNISNIIFQKNFFTGNHNSQEKKQIISRITDLISFFTQNNKKLLPQTVIEDYIIKERISKFIMNSSNLYLFYNHEVRFPFWDTTLLSYFKNLPTKYKRNKLLFNEVIEESFFTPYNINFSKKLGPTLFELYSQIIKMKFKPFFPKFIKKIKLRNNDILNNYHVTNLLKKQMINNNIEPKKNIQELNERIIEWYLHYSKNKLK